MSNGKKQIIKNYKAEGDLDKQHQEYYKSRDILKIYKAEDFNKISNIDLYLLLDLDEYRDKKIPDNILKYVYKQKQRQYHPDVSKGMREAFIMVKKAYEIFSDIKLRRFYDSSYFHIEIPEDRIYLEDDFYNTFTGLFTEYGRFAVNKPVVMLERKNNQEEFYEYWNNYKSNRTCEDIDEYFSLGEYEKGEYGKTHKEIIQKRKNEDISKLRQIIKIAYKRDPRIKTIQEQLEEMKIEKEKRWSEKEISTLKRLNLLFGKVKKSKWETITEKLVESTKVKRTVKEVMEQAEKMNIKK